MPKLVDTEHLYATTVRVFAELGFRAMTTKEVARRAGANEVTLFRRHGTKANLVVAALQHCLSDAPLARVEASGDLRSDLLAITRAYAETNALYGAAVFALLDEVARHPELRGALDVLVRNVSSVAAIIAAHQAEGRLVPGDPRGKLVFLFAPLMAAGLWKRAGVAPADFALSPEEVVEAFLVGHEAPARP